jgi:hypothetical protein
LYRVETGTGYYAYVFEKKRADQLKRNLKSGTVFNFPRAKRVKIKPIKKPTRRQKLEARINEILSTKSPKVKRATLIKHLEEDSKIWKKLSNQAEKEYKEDLMLIKKLKGVK